MINALPVMVNEGLGVFSHLAFAQDTQLRVPIGKRDAEHRRLQREAVEVLQVDG